MKTKHYYIPPTVPEPPQYPQLWRAIGCLFLMTACAVTFSAICVLICFFL